MILSIFLAGEYVIKTDHWCLGRDLLILQLFGWSCKTEKWECDLLIETAPWCAGVYCTPLTHNIFVADIFPCY